MFRPCTQEFVDGVSHLHEAYRDIVAEGLALFIKKPDSWGCVEDGVYAFELYRALELAGYSMLKPEFSPLQNRSILTNAINRYIEEQDYLFAGVNEE